MTVAARLDRKPVPKSAGYTLEDGSGFVLRSGSTSEVSDGVDAPTASMFQGGGVKTATRGRPPHYLPTG